MVMTMTMTRMMTMMVTVMNLRDAGCQEACTSLAPEEGGEYLPTRKEVRRMEKNWPL